MIVIIPTLRRPLKNKDVSTYLPFSHDESHLVYPPKANLHIWEEPLGDRIVVEYLKQWWRLFDEEATRGGGENFTQLLYLREDKQHFGGEECNIPKI